MVDRLFVKLGVRRSGQGVLGYVMYIPKHIVKKACLKEGDLLFPSVNSDKSVVIVKKSRIKDSLKEV